MAFDYNTALDDSAPDVTADPAASAAADVANNPPVPGEQPAQYELRRADQSANVARAQYVKAKNFFGQAAIPTTQAGGIIQPITDETGAPLTQLDKSNSIAYDSAGKPRKIAYQADGSAELSDPYAGAPTQTDKQGNIYATPRGLPWFQTGTDPAVAQAYTQQQQLAATSQAASALGQQVTGEQKTLKQTEKDLKAKTAALTSIVPSITPSMAPQAAAKEIDTSFNARYAAPEANARSGYFGYGDLTPEAQAIRTQIDSDKATAHARLDQIQQQGQALQQAKAATDAKAAQAQQLQSVVVSAKLAKAQAAGVNLATSAPANTSDSPAAAQTTDSEQSPPIDQGQSLPPEHAAALQNIEAAKQGQKPYRYDDTNGIQFDPQNAHDALQQGVADGVIDPQWAKDNDDKFKAVQDKYADLQKAAGSAQVAKALLHGAGLGGAFMAGAIPGAKAGAALGALVPGAGETGVSEGIGAVIGGLATGTLATFAAKKGLEKLGEYSDAVKSLNTSAELHPVADSAGQLVAFATSAPSAISNMVRLGKIAGGGLEAAKAIGLQVGKGAAGALAFEGVARPAFDAARYVVADQLGIPHDQFEAPSVKSLLTNVALGVLLSGHSVEFKDYSAADAASILIRAKVRGDAGIPADAEMDVPTTVEAFKKAGVDLKSDAVESMRKPLDAQDMSMFNAMRTKTLAMQAAGVKGVNFEGGEQALVPAFKPGSRAPISSAAITARDVGGEEPPAQPEPKQLPPSPTVPNEPATPEAQPADVGEATPSVVENRAALETAESATEPPPSPAEGELPELSHEDELAQREQELATLHPKDPMRPLVEGRAQMLRDLIADKAQPAPVAESAPPEPLSNAETQVQAAPSTKPTTAEETPPPVHSPNQAEPALSAPPSESSVTPPVEAVQKPEPVAAKKGAAVAAPVSAAAGGEKALSAKPTDVLHEAKNVKLTTPKGARFIRVTDSKGRQIVEPIDNVTKGANVFHQAGPFKKVEAGVMNSKKQFVPLKGDVTATDANAPAPEAPAKQEQAPAKPAQSPEAASVQKLANAALALHHSELDALGHPHAFEVGETRADSGIETDVASQRIRMDPEKLVAATKGMTPFVRAEFVKRAVAHEVIHVGTLKYAAESTENRAKLLALAGDEELMKRAGDAYGPEWDKQSDFAKAAEAARMLIEGPEKLTESSYKFLKDFLDWMKGKLKNLSKDAREVLDGIRKKLGTYEKDAQEQVPASAGDGLGAAKPKGDPFYSQLSRTVETLPQETMTVAQARAAIAKGAKADEIKMSGILDDPLSPLSGKQPGEKVTRAELQDYAIDRQTRVQDVTLKQMSPADKNGALRKAIERGISLTEPDGLDPDEFPGWAKDAKEMLANADAAKRALERGDFREASELVRSNSAMEAEYGDDPAWGDARRIADDEPSHNMDRESLTDETHFSHYQLPGADEGSYREMFVTWPTRDTQSTEIPAGWELKKSQFGTDTWDVFHDGKKVNGAINGKDRAAAWVNGKALPEPIRKWEDGHADYANVQNPVVRIRRNIRTDADGKRTYFIEEMQGPNPAGQEKMPTEVRKRIYEIGMKRALRDAADEGADRIAWTTGQQQVDRYPNIATVVDKISWEPHDSGVAVKIHAKNGSPISVVADKDGKVMESNDTYDPGDSRMVGKNLAEIIGKDPTQKIIGAPTGELAADGLKVGGEGLKRLYDTTLPRIANDLAKKFGVKAGTTQMKVGEEGQYGGDTALPDFEQKLKQIRNAWDGPGRTPEGWRAWNVTLDAQARDVLKAMHSGATYGEAMHDRGSEALAEHFGGQYSIADKMGDVHSLDLPAELKEHTNMGQALFAAKPERLDTDPARRLRALSLIETKRALKPAEIAEREKLEATLPPERQREIGFDTIEPNQNGGTVDEGSELHHSQFQDRDETGAFTKGETLGAANPFGTITKQIGDEVKSRGLKDTIKARHDAIENLSDYHASHTSNSIELDYPDAKDREAAPFVIEGSKDPAKLTAHLVSERQKIATSSDPKLAKQYLPVIDHAIANQASIVARRGNHDKLMAQSHAALRASGRDVGTIDDYVRRVLDPPQAVADSLPNPLFSMGGGTGSSPKGFTKGRVFETLGDALHAGYRPATTDLADLDHDRIAAGTKLIEQDSLINALKGTMAPSDGKPVIGKLDQVKKLSGDTEAQVPRGYTVVQVGGQPLPVHNQVAGLMRALTTPSALRQGTVGRALLKTAAFAKHGTLVFDSFHLGRLAYKMVSSGGGASIGRGVAALRFSDADLPRAVAVKEVTNEDAKWAVDHRHEIDQALRSGANIGRVADNLWDQSKQSNFPVIKQVQGFNRFLFKKLAPAAMTQAWVANYERNASRPGTTSERAARQTSKEMNEQFGNLRSQGIFKSKTAQDIASLFALAPNWTVSQFINEMRSYAQMGKVPVDLLRGKGLHVGNSARAFIAGALGLFALNQLINFMTRKKPTWQNEDGHKEDAWLPVGKRGVWFNPFEMNGEYTLAMLKYMAQHQNALDAATHILSNKMSPFARAAKEGILGTDYAGRHFLTGADRARAAITDALPSPIGLSGVFEKDPRQPFGYRINRQPGSAAKQLLQSAGMKVTPAQSPRTQMFAIAQPFRPDRGGSDAAGEFTELRRSLDNDNLDAAKSEVAWLYKQGKDRDAVLHAVGVKKDGTIAPELFAGGVDRERAMKATLTPTQTTLYNAAQSDHRENAMRLLRIINDVPAPPAKPKPSHAGTAGADWWKK